jgi:hypothetical protein
VVHCPKVQVSYDKYTSGEVSDYVQHLSARQLLCRWTESFSMVDYTSQYITHNHSPLFSTCFNALFQVFQSPLSRYTDRIARAADTRVPGLCRAPHCPSGGWNTRSGESASIVAARRNSGPMEKCGETVGILVFFWCKSQQKPCKIQQVS